MPHARDLQDGHSAKLYCDVQMLHPHDDSHAYQFCPRCGGPLERRVLKADRARAAGLHAVRVRLLPRSEDRRRHDHPIAERAHRPRAARDRAGLRQVGVSRAATSIAASR